MLIEHYQVYFVAENEATALPWLEEYIGVPAWHHTVITWRRDLLYGDYLISKQKEGDTMATLLEFGSDTFKASTTCAPSSTCTSSVHTISMP